MVQLRVQQPLRRGAAMPRGQTQRIKDFIAACHTILKDIHPASVRAVAYQLFINKLIESMAKKCTNRVSEHLVTARKEGLIPWRWVVDETRTPDYPLTWVDAGSAVSVNLLYGFGRFNLQNA